MLCRLYLYETVHSKTKIKTLSDCVIEDARKFHKLFGHYPQFLRINEGESDSLKPAKILRKLGISHLEIQRVQKGVQPHHYILGPIIKRTPVRAPERRVPCL